MGNRASSGQKELPPADAAQQYFNYSGGCPVLPPQPTPSTSAPSTQPDSCPARYKNPNVYNVYGQRVNDPSAPIPASPLRSIQGADILDPKNNMPLEANQLPYPGQRKPLSTDRVSSSIPKGGTFGTWQYPSPQMVFNGESAAEAWAATSTRHTQQKKPLTDRTAAPAPAPPPPSSNTAALKRKGKGDDIDENDMDGFIAAHNSEWAAAKAGPPGRARTAVSRFSGSLAEASSVPPP